MKTGRVLFAAEDAIECALDAVTSAKAAATSFFWPRRKSDLSGRSCHCTPGAPFHLLHSEGLREGCDVVVDFGANVRSPRRYQVPVKALAGVAAGFEVGDIVHVKAELLPDFLKHVFPRVRVPIVLVTGDSDYAPVRTHQHILNDERIVHWFAQNCDVPFRHRKLTRIPIGIDNPVYTKLEKRIGFLIDILAGKSPFDPTLSRNDMGDQTQLQSVARQIARAVGEKPAKALCTFHMNQKLVPNILNIPDRLEAYQILRNNPDCHFVTSRLPQDECWRLHADFAFEISPRGNGLDCFRTWEALALDTIPIVKTTTLDPLFVDEKLPVVVLSSYAEITAEALARWKAEMRDCFTPDMKCRLTNDYWLRKIRAVSEPFRGGRTFAGRLQPPPD
jgi:hypothetical protein